MRSSVQGGKDLEVNINRQVSRSPQQHNPIPNPFHSRSKTSKSQNTPPKEPHVPKDPPSQSLRTGPARSTHKTPRTTQKLPLPTPTTFQKAPYRTPPRQQPQKAPPPHILQILKPTQFLTFPHLCKASFQPSNGVSHTILHETRRSSSILNLIPTAAVLVLAVLLIRGCVRERGRERVRDGVSG